MNDRDLLICECCGETLLNSTQGVLVKPESKWSHWGCHYQKTADALEKAESDIVALTAERDEALQLRDDALLTLEGDIASFASVRDYLKKEIVRHKEDALRVESERSALAERVLVLESALKRLSHWCGVYEYPPFRERWYMNQIVAMKCFAAKALMEVMCLSS
jgi:hypothetical protein